MPLQNESLTADIIGGLITGIIAVTPFVLYFVGIL